MLYGQRLINSHNVVVAIVVVVVVETCYIYQLLIDYNFVLYKVGYMKL